MKKVCLIGVIISLFLLSFPVMATEETVNPNEKISCYSLDAVKPLLGDEELIENADSIVLYEKKSNTLMYAWNADEQVAPASLVKIMTGLITAEQGKMDEAVTVKESVLNEIPTDAATAGLQPDEVLSVEQLLYCMMVSSANDAAAVLADHIAGSQEAFVAQMNAYAKELGCTNTNFTNVHGLHDEMQYTTARDMAKILSAAMDNPLFCTVFGTDEYTIESTNKSEIRYLVTGNYLMSMDDMEYYYDSRVTGGRTGVTNDGYRNIAVSAESDTMQLVCVLTGAESVLAENGYSVEVFGGYTETSDLLDMGFDNYQVAQVVYADQVLTQMEVVNGECDVVLGPQSVALAVLPDNAKLTDLTYRYPVTSDLPEAPIKKGDIVSSVEIWYKTMCVAQSDLYAMNDVDVLQLSEAQVQNPQTNSGGKTALWIILGIVIAVPVVLVVMNLINRFRHIAAGKLRRRNRRNRRRSG